MTRSVLFALMLAACVPDEGVMTQVMVVVDAESGVREQTDKLKVFIRGSDGIDGLTSSKKRFDGVVDPPDFPVRIAVAPFEDDAERVFVIEVTGESSDGEIVTQGRLISGYSQNKLREVRMTLDDDCIGVVCEDIQTTCRAGECVDARDKFVVDAVDDDDDDDLEPDASRKRDARAETDDDTSRADTTPDFLDAGMSMMADDPGMLDEDDEAKDAGASPAAPDAAAMQDAGVPTRKPDAGDAGRKADAGAASRALRLYPVKKKKRTR